jgi:hypothetical protein
VLKANNEVACLLLEGVVEKRPLSTCFGDARSVVQELREMGATRRRFENGERSCDKCRLAQT